MARYFALYLAPIATVESWMASTTPAERKASMEAWGKWMSDNAKSFADIGSPLGKTKKVTADGVLSVKNDILGYSIIEASSHDEAAKLLKGHPHFQIPGASVEVLEITPMTGM